MMPLRVTSNRRQRATALIEAAICFIVLFILLAGIVNGGRLFTTQTALTNAAREGARWAAGHPTDYNDIAQSVLNELISGKLVPTNATMGTVSTVGTETTVPIRSTLSGSQTAVISASGKVLGTGTHLLAEVKIRTLTDTSSTSGQKIAVGVKYGFRPIMGGLVGMNSKNLYVESQMIRM